MARATRSLTFEEYLTLEDTEDLEERRELIDGELVELPPESGPNLSIANYLFLKLVEVGIPLKLIHPHACEVQVPVIQPKDAQNRYPDLVVLKEEHLPLIQRRATITLKMPPPALVVEVVSPGDTNRLRDYNRKREQYQQRGISEYWLIDPEQETVVILELQTGKYVEVGAFRGSDRIKSRSFPKLNLTAEQVLAADS